MNVNLLSISKNRVAKLNLSAMQVDGLVPLTIVFEDADKYDPTAEFRIDWERSNGSKISMDALPIQAETNIILPNDIFNYEGQLKCQVTVLINGGEVWHSSIANGHLPRSIQAKEQMIAVTLVYKNDDTINFNDLPDIDTTVQDFEGRNLLLNSNFYFDKAIWTKQGAGSFDTGGGWSEMNGDTQIGQDILKDIDNGTTVTASADTFGYGSVGFRFAEEAYTPESLEPAIKRRFATWEKTEDGLFWIMSTGYTQFRNIMLAVGSTVWPYYPAPEDLKHAKQIMLKYPIRSGRYSIQTNITDVDRYMGVWLGTDYFVGYFNAYRDWSDDYIIEFDVPIGIESDTIIFKTLNDDNYLDGLVIKRFD